MKFLELKLHPLVQAGVEACQFVECTDIQTGAIPPILEGKDVAGLAQTGTGKTAAFLLPLMDRIVRSREAAAAGDSTPSQTDAATANPATNPAEGASTEASASEDPDERPTYRYYPDWKPTNVVLVLVPTRELAEQVLTNFQTLAGQTGLKAVAVYGGTSYEPQTKAISQGVQIIVATPGRLIDLFKEHIVDLNQVRAIVFDEADRMFDMGFKDDMKYILRRVPRDRQFLVFSATLNFEVLEVAYEHGANPVEVNVSRDQAKAENVDDFMFHVGHDEKGKFLLSILKKEKPRQTIVFSNFRHNVERVAEFLTQNGHPAMGISSLLTQAQRLRVMGQFREENEKNILVATDLAARGLDIKGVDMVVNFELPDDPENYVHRIGRTGRAGATGKAFSLVSDRDVEALQRIESFLDHKLSVLWLEDAEIVQDFKPFPADHGRRRYEGAHGGRDQRGGPRGRGGPRRDGRSGGGGGRRDDRGRDDRGRDGRRSGGGRDFDRDRQRRPQGGTDAMAMNGNGAAAPGSEGQQQGGQQNRRPHHGGHGGRGGRRFESRDRGPRRDGREGGRDGNRSDRGGQRSRSGQRTDRRPDQRSQQRSFKHRPQQAKKSAAQAGLAGKVSGFFKKLFGSADQSTKQKPKGPTT